MEKEYLIYFQNSIYEPLGLRLCSNLSAICVKSLLAQKIVKPTNSIIIIFPFQINDDNFKERTSQTLSEKHFEMNDDFIFTDLILEEISQLQKLNFENVIEFSYSPLKSETLSTDLNFSIFSNDQEETQTSKTSQKSLVVDKLVYKYCLNLLKTINQQPSDEYINEKEEDKQNKNQQFPFFIYPVQAKYRVNNIIPDTNSKFPNKHSPDSDLFDQSRFRRAYSRQCFDGLCESLIKMRDKAIKERTVELFRKEEDNSNDEKGEGREDKGRQWGGNNNDDNEMKGLKKMGKNNLTSSLLSSSSSSSSSSFSSSSSSSSSSSFYPFITKSLIPASLIILSGGSVDGKSTFLFFFIRFILQYYSSDLLLLHISESSTVCIAQLNGNSLFCTRNEQSIKDITSSYSPQKIWNIIDDPNYDISKWNGLGITVLFTYYESSSQAKEIINRANMIQKEYLNNNKKNMKLKEIKEEVNVKQEYSLPINNPSENVLEQNNKLSSFLSSSATSNSSHKPYSSSSSLLLPSSSSSSSSFSSSSFFPILQGIIYIPAWSPFEYNAASQVAGIEDLQSLMAQQRIAPGSLICHLFAKKNLKAKKNKSNNKKKIKKKKFFSKT